MCLRESYIGRIIREVINESLLLEGDSRINAVNRFIDEKFSDLPLNSVVSSSDYYVNGNPNTTWREYILFNLRHTFGLMGNSDVKYLLPVARLAYSNEVGFDRRNDNGTEVGILRRIVQRMKKDDALFQQIKSNPDTTYTELYDRLRNEFKAEDDADAESADNVEVGNSDYDIIVVEDFNTAQYYGDFSCSSSKLCYTQDEGVWDGYKGNEEQNKCYLCLRHGWEDIPEEATEGNPYDDYGTSMIFVFIAPDGSIATSNCRWNHGNKGEYVGGTDHAFTKTMLAQTVGMPFSSVFKPYSEDELHSRGYVTFNDAESMLNQGYELEDIFDAVNNSYDDLTRVKLHNKYNFVTFDGRILSEQWFDYASLFINGFSVVQNDGKFNLLESDGEILCGKWFDSVDWFRNGYATGVLDGVRYKIDTDGNIYSDVSESKSRYKSDIDRILELNNKLSGRFFLTESSKSHAAKRDTRIVIKNLFPDEDLESEYVDSDVRNLLHRTNKGELTWLDFYERYIYEYFFLTLSEKIDDSSVIRLEPAIARIAYGELNLAMLLDNLKQYDVSRNLRLLKEMLVVIYDNVKGIAEENEKVDVNFIDGNYDLSGKSFSELYSIIGEVASYHLQSSYGHLAGMEIDSSRYRLINLGRSYYGNPDISAIGNWTGLNGGGALCYTQSEYTWDDYINKNGKNTSYVLLRDDWKDLDGRDYSEDRNPYDYYGLSIVWFFVNERGVMTTCNVRWNHETVYPSDASCDMALTEADISHIMGKSFDSIFEKTGVDNIFDILEKIQKSDDINEIKDMIDSNMREVHTFGDGSKIYFFGKISDDEFYEEYYYDSSEYYDNDEYNNLEEYYTITGDLLWFDEYYNLKSNNIISCLSKNSSDFFTIRFGGYTNNILLNRNGDVIVDDYCISVGVANEGYCHFKLKDKKWYYVDVNGNILNDVGFNWASPFVNGYAEVGINRRPNIIDKEGNIMIEDNYGIDEIVYRNGFCFVKYDNKYYKMMDDNFTYLNDDWIESIEFVDNYGLAGIYVKGRGYTIVNKNGEYIVPFTKYRIYGIGEGLYKVYRNDDERSDFLIIYKGKLLINRWLTFISNLKENGWWLIRGTEDTEPYNMNMINQYGVLASRDWYLPIENLWRNHNLVSVLVQRKNGDYNILSTNGKLLSKSWFDVESSFNGYGLAIIKDQQGYNVITKYGDVLLPKGCQEVNLYGDRVDYKDANGNTYRYIKLPDFEIV